MSTSRAQSTTGSDDQHELTAAPLRYSMVIKWSPDDDVFIVDVPELPGCHTHGATYEEAVRMGVDAMETWVDCVDPATLPAPHYFQLQADDKGNT